MTSARSAQATTCLLESVEKPCMLAAPTEPFAVPPWQDSIVHDDHHIAWT